MMVIIQLSVDQYLKDYSVAAPKYNKGEKLEEQQEQQEEEEETCPVCSKNYREYQMIGCYKCEKWVHNECDDIDQVQVNSLAKNVEYICPNCRGDGDKFVTI